MFGHYLHCCNGRNTVQVKSAGMTWVRSMRSYALDIVRCDARSSESICTGSVLVAFVHLYWNQLSPQRHPLYGGTTPHTTSQLSDCAATMVVLPINRQKRPATRNFATLGLIFLQSSEADIPHCYLKCHDLKRCKEMVGFLRHSGGGLLMCCSLVHS